MEARSFSCKYSSHFLSSVYWRFSEILAGALQQGESEPSHLRDDHIQDLFWSAEPGTAERYTEQKLSEARGSWENTEQMWTHCDDQEHPPPRPVTFLSYTWPHLIATNNQHFLLFLFFVYKQKQLSQITVERKRPQVIISSTPKSLSSGKSYD